MSLFDSLIEKRIGFVYSEEGIYEPHMISFTVEAGERVEIGDIVCIKHPSKDVPVFYQVTEVPMRRKAGDYEEDLIRRGQPLRDDTRNYPRAVAKQIGYVDDISKLRTGGVETDELMMLIEHVTPLSGVYVPRSDLIEALLTPQHLGLEIGEIYPNWKHVLKLDLQKLLRQGVLVVGGVGTGKTTTMLSIVLRLVKVVRREGGKPHILIIDKDGEYYVEELINSVGKDEYVEVDVERIYVRVFHDKEDYINRLLDEINLADKRKKPSKEFYEALRKMDLGEELVLDPRHAEELLYKAHQSRLIEVNSFHEIKKAIKDWEDRLRRSVSGIDIEEVIKLLKTKEVIHVNFSKAKDFNKVYRNLANLLLRIYDEALRDVTFGCVVVIDEVHLFAPEKGGVTLASDDEVVGYLRDALHLLATTGARNGITLFVATQRPSLLSKTVSTQMGQNIIAHRVEDVDLQRLEEIMGGIASRVRVLPRGWAIVKALASRIKEPLIVRVRPEAFPKSIGNTAYDRFLKSRLPSSIA
ncbi:MAG: DUF87 domain-containing protein [Zestosphaera sp.]